MGRGEDRRVHRGTSEAPSSSRSQPPTPVGLPAPPPSPGRAGSLHGRYPGACRVARTQVGQRGSGDRLAVRAAAPCLTHAGAGRALQRVTGAAAARARSAPCPPSPASPSASACVSLCPRVLPAAREQPVDSASTSQVSVAAPQPGRPGREERAGSAARR